MKSITQKIIEVIEKKQRKLLDDENMCALCGGTKTIGKWFDFNKNTSDNFTDFNEAKVKDSDKLCYFCKQTISDNFLDSPKGKKCGLRLYSFLVENNKFIKIDLKEKWFYLFEYNYKTPFILCFSETGKKHISFKAKESFNTKNFWVCTEYCNIWFERKKWYPVFQIANDLYQQKVTKKELLSYSISPWKFNKYNLNFKNLKKLKPYKNTEQYKLIISVLQKEEKCELKQKSKQLALFL